MTFSHPTLSTDSESSSPEAKRQKPIFQNVDLSEVPSESASAGEWGMFLFRQIKLMNENIESLKQTSSFAADQAKDALDQIKSVNSTVALVVAENTKLKQDNIELNEKLLRLECYQRRNNLVFEGIRETRYETDYDVYQKLVAVLREIPQLRNCAHLIRISRCHRLGPYIPNQHRPVIAHFHWFGDLRFILGNRSQLPSGIYVREDFPPEIEDRRRVLRPIFNAASHNDNYRGKVKLSVDKLIVNHKVYTVAPVNNLKDLPEDLNPMKLSQRENDELLAYFGQGSPYSNFNKIKFNVNGVPYNCGEQFIQASKATEFNDDVMHQKIMKCESPYQMKEYGKRIKGFIPQRWEQKIRTVAVTMATAKFQQNPGIKQLLLSTGTKVIGEATKERPWGIGLRLTDPGILTKSQWTGDNIMGNAIMEVRENLRSLPR